MRRVHQVTSAVFFVVTGLFVILEVRELDYYTDIGPGPGFLPFWLGVGMAVLSAVRFGEVSLRADAPMKPGFLPDRSALVRILSILVALVLSIWLVDALGFSLTMFGFLLFLLMVLGRQNLLLTLFISVAGSFGTYYVFRHWLHVFLPGAPLGFLRTLGL